MHDVTLGSNPPYLLRATMLQESETLANQVTPTSCHTALRRGADRRETPFNFGLDAFPSIARGIARRGYKSLLTRENFDPESVEPTTVRCRSVSELMSFFSTLDIGTLRQSDALNFMGHFGFEFLVFDYLCQFRSNVKTKR